MTLTFELLTLKLVCESHRTWGTFVLNLGTLGLWVLCTRRTDGRTKATLIAPLRYGRGHNEHYKIRATISNATFQVMQVAWWSPSKDLPRKNYRIGGEVILHARCPSRRPSSSVKELTS